MTPERWRQLKPLFQGALDLPADQRESWLRLQPGIDDALVAEALALFAAHDRASSPLDVPVDRPSDPPREPLRGLLSDLPAGTGTSTTLAPGTRVGSYRIERELGSGGIGVVYLAYDDRLHRAVALKALRGDAAGDPVMRERLRREAMAAMAIKHPGIASVYRLEEIDGALYLATEYIPGRTLRELLDDGPLPLHRALATTADILRALGAAHEAGIVHRDLKPENILVTVGDAVKIVDFGIARFDRIEHTRLTIAAAPGTPAYMAPEQLGGAVADARADLYAVGVIFAEIVSGRHPLAPDAPSLPGPLQALADRALARDPATRFQTAAEMLHAIEALLAPPVVRGADRSAVRWWQFHQCAAGLVYWLMLVPAWSARAIIGGSPGRLVFLTTLAGVVLASVLRFHLCFSSRHVSHEPDGADGPDELARLRAQVGWAVRAGDLLFVTGLAIAGALIGDRHDGLMMLLVAVALGAALAAAVIEPATTRAAFTRRRRS